MFLQIKSTVRVWLVAILLSVFWGNVSKAEELLIIDNFEGAQSKSQLMIEWEKYTDSHAGGDSKIEFAINKVPADSTGEDQPEGHVASLHGHFGDGFSYPFFGMRTFFKKGGTPVDLSSYKGVWIRLKNENDFALQLLTANVTDYNEFSFTVSSSDEWKTLKIPFSVFEQSAFFGKKVGFSVEKIRGIVVHVTGAPETESEQIEIDQIAFYG